MFGPKGSASIFTETYSDARAWADEALLAKWQRIAEVRAESNRQIEALRAEGKLGSSLQAEVTISAGPKRLADARAGSATTCASCSSPRPPPSSVGRRRRRRSEFFVTATSSAAAKCERCWHYRDDVGVDPAHPTICGRCTSNLFGAGEPRAHRLMAGKTPGLALALARHRRGGGAARPDHQDADRAQLPAQRRAHDHAVLRPRAGAQHRRRVLVPRRRERLAALVLHRPRRGRRGVHRLAAGAPRRPAAVLLGAGADPRRRGRQRRSTASCTATSSTSSRCTGAAPTSRRSTSPTARSSIGAALLILDELLRIRKAR